MTQIEYCTNDDPNSKGELKGIQFQISAFYAEKPVQVITLNTFGNLEGNCDTLDIEEGEQVTTMQVIYDDFKN